jgi:hypothetical protein
MAPSQPARDIEGDAPQHGDVESQVATCAIEAVVAENVSDRLHANAAAEEPHRERMPQAIHMLAAVGQAGLTHALAEEIPDGTVFEPDVWAARPQEEHRRSTRLSLATVLQVLT